MLLDQRRQEILAIIENRGYVSLHELVERLKASESTVRRDLEYLDGIGQIRRTRGGAAYVGESLVPLEDRVRQNVTEKERIAACAAELIQPGDTLLLDGGTTTLELARRLVGKPLQVLTNSLPIANLLVNQPLIELIFLGGYLYPRTGVALGSIALQSLAGLHVPRVIMGTGGITEKGFFNSNTLLVECERQMLAAADEVWVLADHTKFGHAALAHLCPLSSVHRVVSDRALGNHWQETIQQAGVELLIADETSDLRVPLRSNR